MNKEMEKIETPDIWLAAFMCCHGASITAIKTHPTKANLIMLQLEGLSLQQKREAYEKDEGGFWTFRKTYFEIRDLIFDSKGRISRPLGGGILES